MAGRLGRLEIIEGAEKSTAPIEYSTRILQLVELLHHLLKTLNNILS